MNQAHIHLLVNHVSLFTISFGLIALCWAIFKKSHEMHCASVILFLVAGLFSWIATETGEGAEEIVERLPVVTKSLIHNHEEAAETANISAAVLAVAAIGLGLTSRFKPKKLKATQFVTLIIALVSVVLMARTAQLGGQIRHSEIREAILTTDDQ